MMMSTSHDDFMDMKVANAKSPHYQPPETSMKFKAVADMDGNSWSSRFPRLLCYNSAVIRIVNEPYDWEEYFMADLIPNVHYIPASFTNFTDVAKYWMSSSDDPDLDEQLLTIRNNAREFCRTRFVEDEVNYDMLSVIDGYIETLYKDDPDWLTKWRSIQHLYVGELAGGQDHHGGFWDGVDPTRIYPSLV